VIRNKTDRPARQYPQSAGQEGENVEARADRVNVRGLREADPSTLGVLTQDLLQLPLGQLDPSTLLDLFAISELTDSLPKQLGTDMAACRDRHLRQINDLPDGAPLASWATEMTGLTPALAPTCLRQHISQLRGDRNDPDAVAALDALIGHWESEDPQVFALPEVPSAETPKPKVVKPATKKKTPTRRTTVSRMDEERVEWVKEDILSRLSHYGSRGLKQQIIVAGSRHRSPWTDLEEAEVLAVLRQLKRDELVRHSAGRWSGINAR